MKEEEDEGTVLYSSVMIVISHTRNLLLFQTRAFEFETHLSPFTSNDAFVYAFIISKSSTEASLLYLPAIRAS
jgi:hypothetical protein